MPPAPATVASGAERAAAANALAAGVSRYRGAFQQGQAIVGTVQYPDGMAGIQAMDDPNSAAAPFPRLAPE
jgi:hypothetical protein